MPNFPGIVRQNNALYPIVDATDKQLKGFGLFESVADRSGLSDQVQTDGFLAVTQVNNEYKAFVYSGNTWEEEASWTELGNSTINGGNRHAVLAKLSDANGNYDWTEQPQFEAVSITRHNSELSPSIDLHRSRGSDESALSTQIGDVIAEISFTGSSIGGRKASAGKMVFTQVEHPGYGPGIATKIDFFVGTEEGDSAALSINQDRVVSIARQETIPPPVLGGLYADSSDQLFFGVKI